MAAWLQRTALLLPWLTGALALLLFSTHPDKRTCDYPGLTSADHAYLTLLRTAGGGVALATVALIWLLTRRRRVLRDATAGGRYTGFDALMVVATFLIVAGLTTVRPLLVPFLLAGYLAVVFLIGPIAAAGVYFSAAVASADSLDDSAVAQRFIHRALIFHWVNLLLLIPGVFTLLALRISPICLN